MTIWPERLAGRITLSLCLAAFGIAVLAVVVQQSDAAAAAAAAATAPLSPPPAPPGLGFRLAPSQGDVLLVGRLQAVGPTVAPVVQILADGSVALRRPAPLPRQPGPAASVVAPAAILLPGRSLPQLGPQVRGALVELVGQLVASRPVPADRVRAVDVAIQPAELAALLSWVH